MSIQDRVEVYVLRAAVSQSLSKVFILILLNRFLTNDTSSQSGFSV